MIFSFNFINYKLEISEFKMQFDLVKEGAKYLIKALIQTASTENNQIKKDFKPKEQETSTNKKQESLCIRVGKKFVHNAVQFVPKAIKFYESRFRPQSKNDSQEKQIQELQKILQTNCKKLQQFKERAQNLSNPDTFFKEKKQFDDKFIEKICQINFIRKQNGREKKIIIGLISVGKSSILKKYFDPKVQIGQGQTTQRVECIYRDDYVEIYDSPGINQDNDIRQLGNLNELYSKDEFYICYNSSIKNVQIILRVLSSIAYKNKQNIYLIRTQCDRFSGNSNKRTIQDELKVDRQYLERLRKTYKYIPHDIQILTTSMQQQFSDNAKLVNYLKTRNNNSSNPQPILVPDNQGNYKTSSSDQNFSVDLLQLAADNPG